MKFEPTATSMSSDARSQRRSSVCLPRRLASREPRCAKNMGDWDDDDWESADLTLPGGGAAAPAASGEWSDEEGHDPEAGKAQTTEAVMESRKAAPAPKKEKSEFEKKIEAREKREKEEAAKRAAKEAKASSGGGGGSGGGQWADDGGELDLMESRSAAPAGTVDSDDDFDDPFLGGKPMNINQNRAPAARGATGAIEDSAPKTDKEFEALAGLINGKLSQYEGKKGHLVCLKALLKSATAPMSTDECKDLASFVSVLSNAKIQADRDKDKGKKKGAPKKKTIVASKQSANDYGDDYDDFGDF